MNSVFVKLRLRGKGNKYRKMLSTSENIYPNFSSMVNAAITYAPGALSEADEWFQICDASLEEYALDIFEDNFDSLDFDSLAREEFANIDFLFVKQDDVLMFQKVTKTKLATKKHIWEFGGEYQFQSESNSIVINTQPDAIYHQDTDTLYFRRLESITTIFKGIDQLYREATYEETSQFLQSSFIQLGDGFAADNVKTANRKKIALATKTLENLKPADKKRIFTYIRDYCPALKTPNNKFSVNSEEELRLLLYGIEQRFYTTPVGNEQRIANSVILLGA